MVGLLSDIVVFTGFALSRRKSLSIFWP